MASSAAADRRLDLRALAERTGMAGFWRWWTSQLRELLPSSSRTAMKRRRVRPAIVFESAAAIFFRPELRDGELVHLEAARVPLDGDAALVAQSAREALDLVARASAGSNRQVIIALTPAQALKKRLVYPSATEERVKQVIGYDLDRHTPFKPDELYFDAVVVQRDPARKEIVVELAAALRTMVDQLRRQVADWGGTVVAVVPDRAFAGAVVEPPQHNLLAEADRVESGAWRKWGVIAPLLLLMFFGLAAVAVPIYHKYTHAILLAQQADQARVQATAADGLRRQLEQVTGDYNFVLERKYAFPSTVQLLDDVTRLLPDDTWLTQLEFKSGRGKDATREMLLRGESANAGRLVTLLEESKLFEQAAPRSPTTKIQPGPGEIFDLGAQLRPLPLPARVQVTASPDNGGQGGADAATPARPQTPGSGTGPEGVRIGSPAQRGPDAAAPGASPAASAAQGAPQAAGTRPPGATGSASTPSPGVAGAQPAPRAPAAAPRSTAAVPPAVPATPFSAPDFGPAGGASGNDEDEGS